MIDWKWQLTHELLEMVFDQSFALVSAHTRAQAGVPGRNGDRLYEVWCGDLWFALDEIHVGSKYRFPDQSSKGLTKRQAQRLWDFLDGPWGMHRRDGELPFLVAYDADKVVDLVSAAVGRFGLPPIKNPTIDMREMSELLWPGEPSDLESLLKRCGYVPEGPLDVEYQHGLSVNTLRIIGRKVRDA
ncbi:MULTISPECIES: hypothetical protein [unclassified Methylobacterium]|jgi:hypothetical protein|uniref:hypothetical protein n=1 Tax=unclassified Methylobacterium TaxID=2615210 RepID=UPI0013526217|nr:hypothetical protein [Methylobacterium sp. 2A]MWV22473.1 hypothetical protein [Methylobacterium sp. 2A]